MRQILLDETRTSARLVVNPARVVVDETRRSFAYLSLYGVATDAVIVNRVLPQAATGGYFARWAEREQRELAEIESSFPVPLFHAPLRPDEPIGVEALRALAREMYGARDPAAHFAHGRPIRLAKRDARTLLEIDLPSATRDEIDVDRDRRRAARARARRPAAHRAAGVGGRPERWPGCGSRGACSRSSSTHEAGDAAAARGLARAEPDRGALRARPRASTWWA